MRLHTCYLDEWCHTYTQNTQQHSDRSIRYTTLARYFPLDGPEKHFFFFFFSVLLVYMIDSVCCCIRYTYNTEPEEKSTKKKNRKKDNLRKRKREEEPIDQIMRFSLTAILALSSSLLSSTASAWLVRIPIHLIHISIITSST